MSVTTTLSALETPLFLTSIVNVCAAPPAVTVALWNVFVTARSTSSAIAIECVPWAVSSSECAVAVLTAVPLSVFVSTW